ncbi:hypothetical protein I6N96_04225 [Enterococcus sp. BWM-S5]|uniref:Uncharacterized protein n=1 Tax=Enterococcus larvae TaxID=2794352 RepID=A0ABS4CFZ2_9ENTE|nr:hypothetical protein [Enterococcus larvae]MBP1045471.1 hypothetical protein [Enterococcus larvae]
MIDDLLNELRKNGEKLMIRISVASSACREEQASRKAIDESSREELKVLKTSIQGTAETLGSSIKGQFGKGTQEALKNQSESIEGF